MPRRSRVGGLALSGAQQDTLTLGLLDIALSAAGWGWQSRELSGGGVGGVVTLPQTHLPSLKSRFL